MNTVLPLILRRVASGAATLILLLTVVFFAIRLVADPLTILASEDATEEQVQAIIEANRLDDPLIVQFGHYIAGIVQGDWGVSWRTGQPVWDAVSGRMPATLELAAVAMVLAVIIAIPLGIASAVRPGSLIDSATRVAAVLGQSMPVFWFGILLILLFAVNLRWLPAGGHGSFAQLILPGIALSAYSIPLTMRLTRSAMLETLGQDYIRTAHSKGLSQTRVVLGHGLRNALVPVITVVALRIGHVITGAIILEKVFAYPGIGSLGIDAMLLNDLPVVQFFVVFVAMLMIGSSLLADIAYQLVDPRIRIE